MTRSIASDGARAIPRSESVLRLLPVLTALAAGPANLGLAAETRVAPAADATNTVAKAEAQPEKPAPLPLHQIEGNGGVFSTLQL